jgi:hypothetical protein
MPVQLEPSTTAAADGLAPRLLPIDYLDMPEELWQLAISSRKRDGQPRWQLLGMLGLSPVAHSTFRLKF